MVNYKQFTKTFPGGTKTIQKATAVAGNVPTTLTVPAGKMWLLTSIKIVLTTDVTVVNRYCKQTQRDSADATKLYIQASAIAASTTSDKYFVQGLTITDATLNGLGFGLLSAAEDLYLNISGGVAGDAYDYLVEYLEIDVA